MSDSQPTASQVEGSIDVVVQDVANVVQDVVAKQDVVPDVVKMTVDVIHSTSLCCGLFPSSHTTIKPSA